MMATLSSAKATAAVVTSVVFLVFAAVAVIFRLIARVAYLRSAGSDDIMIVISLIPCIILVILTIYEVKHGLGQNISEVSPEDFSEMLRYLYFAIIVYNLSLASIKISIVLQYLRIFVGKTIRIWCWATIALISVYGVQVLVTAVFTCVPISTFWNGGGRCIDKEFLMFFNAAFNIFTDLVVIALPMSVLSSLKLPRKQKIGLMIVFALGGFVCLVSILRLHSIYVFSITENTTFDNANIAIWSNLEVTTGIICASMPATKSLIARFFPRLLSTNHSRQPTMQSQGRSYNLHSAPSPSSSIQLSQVDGDHKTVTVIGVGNDRGVYGEGDLERNSSGNENGRDIFVTTSMTQDVERKKQIADKKDLVIQLS